MTQIDPTPSQRAAITYPAEGPLLIIAGAGTGKTTTLILRIEHLIETGQAEPDSIIVVTFTERAAAELSTRVEHQLGTKSEGLTVTTFHGLCRNLVAEYEASQDAAKPLIRDNDIVFLLLDRFDSLDMITSQVFKSNPIGAVRESFLPFFNRIRDELLLPGEVALLARKLDLNEDKILDEFPGLSEKTEAREYVRQFRDLVSVYEVYQGWKKDELKVVDYSDMVVQCWEMLSQKKEILKKVRDRYPHIVVDEYQDNNYALNQVMGLLAGDRSSITVVGDEDQCIYSFRGANYYNVHDFKDRFGVRTGKGEILLEENHRSTREILDLANSAIAGDRLRTPKKLVSAQKLSGPKPVWHVGDRLRTLEEIPRLVTGLVEKGYAYGDMAVLCRTWRQARSAAESLERNFIPVDIFEEHFFDNPVVKDVLAWGNLLYDHSRANDALFRILRQQMGRPFTENFFRAQKDLSLPERISHLQAMVKTDHRDKLEWILDVISKLRKKLKQRRRADEMVWEILHETDILKSTRHSYRHQDRMALTNAGRLLSLAEDFAAREEPSNESLNRWLRYMDILSLADSVPEILSPTAHSPEAAGPQSPTGVQVMTIHSSKGLEFPVVIIPFLQSGSFPMNRRISAQIECLPESWYRWSKPGGLTPKEEHLNEERRIFFVGLTRAKREIHLFGPEKRRSVFIKEILERQEQTMEIKRMSVSSSSPEGSTGPAAAGLKQKILVALNRELSAGQYDYARELIEGLRSLDETGKLPEDFSYPSLMKDFEKAGPESSPGASHTELILSASGAEEYQLCPYKYRLGQIDKVPERKSKVQMEFGIIIHRVLEEFHSAPVRQLPDDPQKRGLDYLLSLLDKHWRSEAFDYAPREEEFKRQGKQMLIDYFSYFEAHRPEVVKKEARFEFTLDDLRIRIKGKIDRIDREHRGPGDESLSVTDYKTGRNREKAKSSLQLALYTEALKRNAVTGIEGKPGSARLHYLRFPEEPVEDHIFSSRELDKHLETLKKAAEGIRKREFPTNKGYHCKYCDYRDFLCPAWEEG